MDDEGRVTSPLGTVLSVGVSSHYHAVSLKMNVMGRKSHIVPIHRLVAYAKFGEALFQPGIEVRHKDNDRHNNRPDNILIGTHHENIMDIPQDVRRERSARALRTRTDKMSPKERSELASVAAKARHAAMTPEERNAVAQHASAAFQEKMANSTPEERRAGMENAIRAITKYGPEFRAQVVADYASGLGSLRIAKLRGTSTATVRNILKKEGVAMRTFCPEEHRTQSAVRTEQSVEKCRNAHGLPGVSRTRSGAWTSRARVRGKWVGTGLWPSKEAAHEAYKALKTTR